MGLPGQGKGRSVSPLPFVEISLSMEGKNNWNVFNDLLSSQTQRNNTKFLVGKDGKPVQRFEPGVTPDSPELAMAIEKALR